MNGIYRALGPDGFGAYEIGDRGMFRVDAKPATMLVPGFVDIHIHGAFGIDFMDATPADMRSLMASLRAVGYEGFLPTTVTASPRDVSRALSILPDDPMILGFHLEGPFISTKFPGAQPQDFIVPPPGGPSDWDGILNDPRLRLMTIAPEVPGALDMIRRLGRRGVITSMGHTNSTFAEAKAGHEAGAAHTTHTFNAMRPLHHREAGTVGYALSTDTLSTELIYDRHHVCREAAAILVRNKPAERILAVSDGTRASGMPDGQTVRMWAHECIVKDGTVRLQNGTLAGSAITLFDAFRNLHDDFGPETAIHATSLNPRAALGLTDRPRVWVELDMKLEIVAIHS